MTEPAKTKDDALDALLVRVRERLRRGLERHAEAGVLPGAHSLECTLECRPGLRGGDWFAFLPSSMTRSVEVLNAWETAEGTKVAGVVVDDQALMTLSYAVGVALSGGHRLDGEGAASKAGGEAAEE